MKGRVYLSFSQDEKSIYNEEKSFGEKETTYESEEDFALLDIFIDLEEEIADPRKKQENFQETQATESRNENSVIINKEEERLAQSYDSNKREGENLIFSTVSPSRPYSGPFTLNFDLEMVDSSFNVQGNYSDYVFKVLNSLSSLRYINYSHILEEKKSFLEAPTLNKKTLILDLDETLIHSDLDNRLGSHDHVISFKYEDEEIQIPINFRPGLMDFLRAVTENFEVIIFTASKKEYADVILNYIDPENKIFAKRLYRESCINIENKIYIKDLRIFNRKMEDMIIVDNSLYSFSNQLSNGILINSFYNDREDQELANLLNYLQQYIHGSPDVRSVNESIFNFSTILEEISKQSE
jgi:Dullard-like phosphatase family protein